MNYELIIESSIISVDLILVGVACKVSSRRNKTSDNIEEGEHYSPIEPTLHIFTQT